MDLNEVPGTSFRRHPWEVARARFFQRVLADAGVLARPRAALDIGSGDGYVARTLLEGAPAGSSVLCLDTNYSDDDLRRFRDPALPGLTFAREPPVGRFDLLMLLDVIEHVPDDQAFLRPLLERNLAPGGAVLVSVPAWQSLYCSHDAALLHYRRYSPGAGRKMLAAAGLRVLRSGGLFHSLLLPRALTVLGERVRKRLGRRLAPPPHLGQWGGGAAVSAVVTGALTCDSAVSRLLARVGGGLPGLSFWALCAAPGNGESRG
jgi:hypothetical protein